MVDLHRHDMFSSYDGYGRPSDLAKLAAELGHTSLSTANHGNTNGLVQTYKACMDQEIKPILGVEGYFLPVHKPSTRGFHLCLFAKDLTGYKNLNYIQFEGDKQKYYQPIWDFKLLEEFSEGLICTSACVASYSSQCIKEGKIEQAKKYLIKMQEIFGEDFYLEIQPYKVSEEGLQETVNRELIKLGKQLGIKCILTSDSHRGRKEEIDTYIKMHEMDGHDLTHIEETYSERYMPTEVELKKRFYNMHRKDYGSETAKKLANAMCYNLEEIEDKVEYDIFGQLELKLPQIDSSVSSKSLIIKKMKEGLKKRGKLTEEYLERCKEELKVIDAHGFIDYFLIVADYTQWAKDNGIVVGPGRGSVCNSIVAYALHITDVDSIKFNLDFRRFMRYDKKEIPDIDLDFETDRRDEVIEYLINKYEGHAARVASYGTYKVDNTVLSLAKVCGLRTDKAVEITEATTNKSTIAEIKKIIRKYVDEDGVLNVDGLLQDPVSRQYDRQYDKLITHFSRLYGKVQFIGTHSAGVVLTSEDILQYTSLRTSKDNLYTSYDLNDLSSINLVKFDILGLKTMAQIGECRKLAGITEFDENVVDDLVLFEDFRQGKTDGIFQVERQAAKNILEEIQCDCFNDVIATIALNRPGPLKAGMPAQYAHNKLNQDSIEDSLYYQYTEESYGTIVYQEQLAQICLNIGGMTWAQVDKIQKLVKKAGGQALRLMLRDMAEQGEDLGAMFVKNARKKGMSRADAEHLWDSLLVYSFNKGHACGYSLVAVEEMYFKHYHPTAFWYVKIKYASDDNERERYASKAVKDEVVIFLPHVNFSTARTRIRTFEGEQCIQKGLSDLKGVGEKAADEITRERKENGIFTSYDNFIDRCQGRVVNKKVIHILEEMGALDFNKKQYIKKVKLYNSALYGRG